MRQIKRVSLDISGILQSMRPRLSLLLSFPAKPSANPTPGLILWFSRVWCALEERGSISMSTRFSVLTVSGCGMVHIARSRPVIWAAPWSVRTPDGSLQRTELGIVESIIRRVICSHARNAFNKRYSFGCLSSRLFMPVVDS